METTKQPLITVVMPNYNGRRFVEQAIDSVLNQTYSNFELLVVDDCSKDDSLRLIQQKAQSDNRIKIIAFTDPMFYGFIVIKDKFRNIVRW